MTKKDIAFIAKKTKLSRTRAALLCEEKEDLDLVINQISLKPVNFSEIQGLSFSLYCKIIIFSQTQDIDFTLSEKAAVAEILGNLFPLLHQRTDFGPFIKQVVGGLNEKSAKYYFIITTLFSDKVTIKDNLESQIKYISKGLAIYNCTLSKHIPQWLKILNRIKNDGFFRINIIPESIPELLESPRVTKPA